MTREEAEAICARYDSRKTRADPPQVVEYFEARWVLDRAGVRPMTAGQRGYIAAVAAHRQQKAQ